MGNAAALPERIDADTARALVGSDRLFQSLLPRAPWAVQKFRRGETISRSEARLIWERETYEGAARASSDKVQEHLLPSKQRYDTSEFDGDAKRAVAALERRLFDALTELKGLRPLRREAAELPILRGKLRRATEDVENVSRTCEQLERRLAAAKCELDGYKRHEGQAVDALKRRSVKLERKLADALEERDIARREADELRKDADASRAELRELSKTQSRQLDAVPETLATTGPSRRRSPSPRRLRSPSPAKEDPSKTGPQRVERDASPARSASPAKSDASAKKRDASPAPAESPKGRDASPEREPEAKFAVGAAVEARYRGKKKFYPGKILKVLGDQKYEIEYSDGDVERGVDEEMIRALEKEDSPAKRDASSERETSKFAAGDAVEARFGGKKKWYAGKILKVLDGARYEVEYDDGDVEKGVDEELIRALVTAPAPAPAAGAFAVGAKVECRYKGKKRYYPGTIADYEDGVYAIDYDDGEKESGVSEELIRAVEEAPAPAPAAASGKYAVGAKVEARYRGKKKWYAGEVTKADGDVYSVTYEDGDVEDGVAEELIRAVEEAAPAPAPAAAAEEGKYAVGSKVECRYKGKKRYYPGRVASYSGGEYSIDYDDGEKESGVAEELIRVLEEAAPAPASASAAEEATSDGFEAGMQVEARYKGKKKWYKGTVMKRNDNGTYEIMYDDGDKESGVAADFVKAAEVVASDEAAPAPAPAARAAKVFGKGDKIEALYKGKKNWYAGVVDRYDADTETYDVTYDDGEVEKGVKQENIARAPGDSELEVGQKIEAKYRGKKKYYPGKIAARSGDTYDIDYDDGEKESGVARNLIREA